MLFISEILPMFVLATLVHEAVHVFNQHRGLPALRVEKAVDLTVAVTLIDPAEYQYWVKWTTWWCIYSFGAALVAD